MPIRRGRHIVNTGTKRRNGAEGPTCIRAESPANAALSYDGTPAPQPHATIAVGAHRATAPTRSRAWSQSCRRADRRARVSSTAQRVAVEAFAPNAGQDLHRITDPELHPRDRGIVYARRGSR